MDYNRTKPTEKKILAKLTEKFCHDSNYYDILTLRETMYYDSCGELIPYEAIEKWASLKTDYYPWYTVTYPDDVKKAAHDFACQLDCAVEGNGVDTTAAVLGFLAGVKWKENNS